MSPCRLRRGAALAAPLLIFCQCLVAASLDVNPVRIDLAGPGRPSELRLTNTGNEAVSVQIDVRRWSQDLNGSDELVDTDALLAVPPLFTVGPGERQIVRIAYLGNAAHELEQSFRLIATEIAGLTGEASSSALSMRLRLSLPVFVAPVLGSTPDIVVSRVRPAPNGTNVVLRNVGNAHAKINQIDLRTPAEWVTVPSDTVNLIRYLLPNAQAEFAIPPTLADPSAIRITAADGRVWEHAMPCPQ
jgi:fimbrial chaperone protein